MITGENESLIFSKQLNYTLSGLIFAGIKFFVYGLYNYPKNHESAKFNPLKVETNYPTFPSKYQIVFLEPLRKTITKDHHTDQES